MMAAARRAKPSGKDPGMIPWLAAQAERRATERSPATSSPVEDLAPTPQAEYTASFARRGEAGSGTAEAAAAAAAAAATQAAAAAASQKRMLLPHRPRSPQSNSLMDMAATVAAMSAAANAAAASAAMIRELRLAQEGKARMPFDEVLGSAGNTSNPAIIRCPRTIPPPPGNNARTAPVLEEIQISTPNTSPIGSFNVQPEGVSRVAALSLAFHKSHQHLNAKVASDASKQCLHDEGADLQDELESEDTEEELQELRAGVADLECFIIEEERSGRCSDRARFALDLAVRGLTALETCADFLANQDWLEEC